MSTIQKKKYKICRRLGVGVFEKCQSQKFALSAASKGQSGPGAKRPKRRTDYGIQLIEKQKVRFTYNVREKQFRNYVEKAISSAKTGLTPSQKLFEQLEMRLDNAVYRTGLAGSRMMARQMVSHGHITVNGRKTTVPSVSLRHGDVIAIREGSKDKPVFQQADKRMASAQIQPWLRIDAKAISASVEGLPSKPDAFLNFQSVVEFYSR